MATGTRDYYEVLGISRTSSAAEIKRAYRKLARKLHPDVNQNDKTAEGKFKELSEAYEVLSDPETRKRYDQFGRNWKSAQEGPPPRSGQSGQSGSDGQYRDFSDIFGQGQSYGGGDQVDFDEFFGSIFGGRRTTSGRGRTVSSRGQDVEAEAVVSIEEAHRGARRVITIQGAVVCLTCKGTGVVGDAACPTCGGSGYVLAPRTVKINIPAGVRDGSQVRIPGQGQPGANGGKPGDLFLHIRLQATPLFEVSGEDDLQIDLPISPWEAVLGAKVSVPTIDGPVSMTIPPGSQAGRRLRLRGQGLTRRAGGRGDQYVRLKVVVPTRPSEAEKELFEKLAAESPFNPRDLLKD